MVPSCPPPDEDCSRRDIEVGVAKKVLVERELPRRGSRRKQQEAIEVEATKKVLVQRELLGGEAEGSRRKL